MSDSRFTGVLRGLRVVDFGHFIAGPMTGMILADQGADVVAVRPPAPAVAFAAAATWDRGKRIVELDLRTPEGRAGARALIARADVVIDNFRPGTMAACGLDPSQLLIDHPALVYCALPGFAPDDPRSELPGYEGVVSAATALYRRSVFDEPGGAPAYSAEPIASSYAAFVAAGAIATALFERTRTGRGQSVQVPLFDAMYQAIGMAFISSKRVAASTSSPHGTSSTNAGMAAGSTSSETGPGPSGSSKRSAWKAGRATGWPTPRGSSLTRR